MKSYLLTSFVALLTLPSLTRGQTLERVNLSSSQQQAALDCEEARISADGRYVVFTSLAGNLVPGDTNGFHDVFRRDRKTNTTVCVSVTTLGSPGGAASGSPAISSDGRYVAFVSFATNLAPDAAPGAADVFVRDMALSSTTLVSVSNLGTQGGQDCNSPSISNDGRYVAFSTRGILAPNDQGAIEDIYVRDLVAGTTVLASVSSSGALADQHCTNPSLSGNGGVVAFESRATTLFANFGSLITHVYRKDLVGGATYCPTADPNWVVGTADSGFASLSFDGRFLCFHSLAPNLVPGDGDSWTDVFVYDSSAGPGLALASLDYLGQKASDDCFQPRISGDGRTVAFTSDASLSEGVPGGFFTPYRRDLVTGAVDSMTGSILLPNGPSFAQDLSFEGSVSVFTTNASNIVPNDTNASRDVIAHWIPPCFGAQFYCSAKANSQGCIPQICAWGQLSLAGPDDFIVRASQELNTLIGIMIWSRSPGSTPFGGGTLCVAPPIIRTPAQAAGGSTVGTDCTGTYAFHFTQAYAASEGISAGEDLYFQYWSRDVFFPPPGNVALTAGIKVQVLP